MLKQMRDGAKSTVVKFVLFGLLLLAMTGLALIGGNSVFNSIGGSDVVAKIGGIKIHSAGFERMVRDELSRKNVSESDAIRTGVPRIILNQEINRQAFNMAAADTDILPGEVLAAQQVKGIIAPYVKRGMKPQEALGRLEQAYNMNESELVASLKSDIATQMLQSIVMSGAFAPKQLVDDAMKYSNEYRSGEYFMLTAKDVPPVKPPSEAGLKSYYETVQSDYTLPEYRALTVITLTRKAVAATIKIPDAQLEQHYKDNLDAYRLPQTRYIAQAVAPDEATAMKVYQAAQKDNNLAAAVKQAGGKVTYLKAEPFQRKQIAEELRLAAFAGTQGTITAPIKTPFGWNILYIKKVIPGKVQPFSAVKGEIESNLAQDKIDDAIYKESNKIEDAIGGGAALQDIAKQFNLPVVVLKKVSASGVPAGQKKPDAKVPNIAKIVSAGFSLEKGEASQMIEAPDGSYQVVGVDDVFPASQPPFSAVRAAVLDRWTKEQEFEALNNKAKNIVARLQKGAAFDKVAAELKQPVMQTGMIQRGETSKQAKLDDDMLNGLFSLSAVGETTTVTTKNALAVLRLTDRKIKMPKDTLKSDEEGFASALQQRISSDFLEQYRQYLWGKYKAHINEKLFDSLYAQNGDSSDSD